MEIKDHYKENKRIWMTLDQYYYTYCYLLDIKPIDYSHHLPKIFREYTDVYERSLYLNPSLTSISKHEYEKLYYILKKIKDREEKIENILNI